MSKHPTGPLYGLLAAVLFGASTPFAKMLLAHCGPVLLAGLLYLGSGLGLGLWYFLAGQRDRQASLVRRDLPWLGGAILCGGVVAPVLLMVGLRAIEASAGSLLLNLEGVFTALLAWFLFRENFDRRIFLGMAAILGGAVLLAWPSGQVHWSLAALPIAGACLAWALDNNLTRRVSGSDPVQIAGLKGLVAGVVNISIALSLGESWPATGVVGAALLLGLLSYGVSLTCFVLALRYLGTARTGAYFSTAPFVGAALSLVFFRESPTVMFWIAGLLMALGVWLHLSENHEHTHTHEPVAHDHEHVHDEHHQHAHTHDDPPGEPHAHPHVHARLTHRHPHYPDLHHRHEH
ncbi:DMT family transporter [soil metagenome]